MGLMHAQRLADVTQRAPDDPVGFVHDFSAWTDDHLGVGYDTQVAADATTIDRLAAGILGERFEPAETPASRFAAAAFQCAAHDETLGAAVARVAHLFAPPAEAFGDPLIASRVNEFVAGGHSVARPPDVPNRKAFESLVTA